MQHELSSIEWVDPKTLIPHPKNRNKHPKNQIDRLAKVLLYQGVRKPIIVSKRSGYIVTGHGTRLACLKNKMEKVPIVRQDFVDDVQEYTHMQADNATALWAELDLASINLDTLDLGPFDTDLLGIKDWQPVAEDKYAGKDADELPNMATNDLGVVLGDVYELGDHRLMCGDSTDVAQVKTLMNGQLADMWIADPPFGVSYVEKNAAVCGGVVKNAVGKEISSDTKSVEELKPFWKACSLAAYEVTTMSASNYWCACQGSDKMMMMMMMMMSEAGWNIRHELIWVKQQFVFGRSDYHYRHEPIIYGWKIKGKHEWYGDRKQDSVFEIDRPHKSDMHPTTKPVELFSKFISNSSKIGDRVFESFGGSGTTLIACEKLGRKSNTMELDPHYCSVIIKRWEEFTGQKAVKLG